MTNLKSQYVSYLLTLMISKLINGLTIFCPILLHSLSPITYYPLLPLIINAFSYNLLILQP